MKRFNESSFNKNPIGTGSYKLKEFKPLQDIELIANDNFLRKPKNSINLI